MSTGITRQKDRPVEPIVWQYPYDPTRNAKQMRFHEVVAKEKLFGGSAGGGKTEAMLAEVLRPILQWGVKCLLLRRTTTAMGEIKERLLLRIPPEVGKWQEQKNTWKFCNGGQLVLGYLEHDNDVQRYAGSEFFMIAWDELTQFSEWQYLRMFHPLRISTSHPSYDAIEQAGMEPYFISATNPGSSGHAWVKGRFIDPAPPGVVWRPKPTLLTPNPGTRIFVPSRLTDNPFLGDAYLANLQGMGEDEQRKLIEGDWDVYEGQMFPEFSRDIHVIPAGDFEIPLGIPKVMGIDYGLVAPFAAVWIALFPDNLHVVYRELYKPELLPEEQVALIFESERKGERSPSRPIPAYLDSSCWNREPTSPKPSSPHQAPRDSIAWRYQKAGLPVRQSDRTPGSRVARVANYKRLLKVQRDGRPRLIVLDNCPEFIRTFGQILRSKKSPEDVDTTGEDHLYDACGYAIAGAGHLPPSEAVARTEINRQTALAYSHQQLDPFRT